LKGGAPAVGTRETAEVKKGDVVLVPRHGGTEIKRDGERLLIVKAPDILAVVGKL